MKVAVIKQLYDAKGVWESVMWKDTGREEIFKIWPSAATLWGLACALKADWYIVNTTSLKSDYMKDIFQNKKRMGIMEKNVKNVFSLKDIDFESYDLVITLDPILEIPKLNNTLLAYFVLEHWDSLYKESIKKPIGNYDLFLNYMMDSDYELHNIPQTISFPFLFPVNEFRSVFKNEKENAIWAEWRFLCALGFSNLWDNKSEEALKRVENLVGIPVRCKGNFNKNILGISENPSWGDAKEYFNDLSKNKYYISLGRNAGPGQGLCEAASLGCICIGENDKAYHRLVCHPECLCKDMTDFPKVFRKVSSSDDFQKEIISYQDESLKSEFEEFPLGILEKAIKLKRKT